MIYFNNIFKSLSLDSLFLKPLIGFGNDSIVLLDRIKLPFFKESCELAKSATNLLPCRIIGWDMQIIPNGPIIIEGSDVSGMVMTDIVCGGHIKYPFIKEILNII